MKFLLWVLWHFVPREEGGDPPADPPPGDPPPGDPPPPPPGDPEGKPDWLADKFWNPDIKAPRTEVLSKSYNELQGKMQEKTDTLKESIIAEMKASAPESYEISLSEDLEIPENVEMNLSAEDPMVEWFFGFAKERGMSQDDVTAAINEYVKIELSNMPDVTAEIGKLGDHGQDRVLRVHNWMESKLPEEQFKALSPMLSTAPQIEALETLMKSSGPGDFDGDTGGKSLTLDELRTMQGDKRYWQEKDPAFIKKVEDGYKRLYGSK